EESPRSGRRAFPVLTRRAELISPFPPPPPPPATTCSCARDAVCLMPERPRGCAAGLCGGLPAHAFRQRHWLVGALQEFDGHEDHLLVAEILEIVDLELAGPISLVPRLAGRVGGLDRSAVMHVLAS